MDSQRGINVKKDEKDRKGQSTAKYVLSILIPIIIVGGPSSCLMLAFEPDGGLIVTNFLLILLGIIHLLLWFRKRK